jgi:hypothetical protein
MIGNCSICPWAISMRSKGSRCGPGSAPAASACSMVIGKTCIRALCSKYGRSSATLPACGNLPNRLLVAISQPDALLTRIVFSGARITLRAGLESLGSSNSHHSKTCVSSKKPEDNAVIDPTRTTRFPAMAQKRFHQAALQRCRAPGVAHFPKAPIEHMVFRLLPTRFLHPHGLFQAAWRNAFWLHVHLQSLACVFPQVF